MSIVSHDTSLRDIQRVLVIMTFTAGILGTVVMLSVPFVIGLYGLHGLWLPAALLIPLALQAWAFRVLRQVASTLPG